jgi:hypothetical protein
VVSALEEFAMNSDIRQQVAPAAMVVRGNDPKTEEFDASPLLGGLLSLEEVRSMLEEELERVPVSEDDVSPFLAPAAKRVLRGLFEERRDGDGSSSAFDKLPADYADMLVLLFGRREALTSEGVMRVLLSYVVDAFLTTAKPCYSGPYSARDPGRVRQAAEAFFCNVPIDYDSLLGWSEVEWAAFRRRPMTFRRRGAVIRLLAKRANRWNIRGESARASGTASDAINVLEKLLRENLTSGQIGRGRAESIRAQFFDDLSMALYYIHPTTSHALFDLTLDLCRTKRGPIRKFVAGLRPSWTYGLLRHIIIPEYYSDERAHRIIDLKVFEFDQSLALNPRLGGPPLRQLHRRYVRLAKIKSFQIRNRADVRITYKGNCNRGAFIKLRDRLELLRKECAVRGLAVRGGE